MPYDSRSWLAGLLAVLCACDPASFDNLTRNEGAGGGTSGAPSAGTGGDAGIGHEPCSPGINRCDPLVTCEVRDGAVVCGACPAGYRGDGIECVAESNVCAINNGGCDLDLEACVDNAGTLACVDRDECLTNNGGCGEASCVNRDHASPVCETMDIDECLGANVCSAAYPCQNKTPGYVCRGQFANWTPTDSPAFAPNGNGTVTDARNGLTWQQSSTAGLSWQAARTHCENLSFAGLRNWRLPTKAELESIVDYTAFPALDANAFKDGTSSGWWSASQRASDPAYAWAVRNIGDSLYLSVASTAAARCVGDGGEAEATPSSGDGGAPPGRYVIDATNGIVSDTQTGLVWTQGAAGNLYAHSNALSYCAELTGGDWRLPSVSELLTIVDPTRQGPALDKTAFPQASSGNWDFWASSLYVGDRTQRWFVRFATGESYVWSPLELGHVRCVRKVVQ